VLELAAHLLNLMYFIVFKYYRGTTKNNIMRIIVNTLVIVMTVLPDLALVCHTLHI